MCQFSPRLAGRWDVGTHTRLREEGAEAVVGVSGLALLGEVAIGLKERSEHALEAEGAGHCQERTWMPCSRQ